MNKIICLAGPTGCGKSGLAARLGEKIGGAVVNADSRQVYADFPIITAQPGEKETTLCPHLLYGFLPTEEKMSAGQYVEKAHACIQELWGQGLIPILTGGTGLYFRSLLHGIAEIPQVDTAVHQKWQDKCALEGSHALHEGLKTIDAEYALKIHPNDRQRITRALEVFDSTGKTFSWWHKNAHKQLNFEYIYIGLDIKLASLEPLLAKRIEQMLDQGALDEARAAMKICAEQEAPGWTGIGCAELYHFLSGRLTIEETKALWKKNTRAYAKRQLTWFRGEPGIHWYTPEDYAGIVRHVNAFL